MFLNTKIVNKLIKEAFKTGLVIAATEESIHLEGTYWMIDIKRDFLPKEIMAKIIELTGWIPEAGERVVANKDGWQYEVGAFEIEKEFDGKRLEVTNVSIKSVWDIYQRVLQDENGKTYLINDVFIDMTKVTELEEGEVFPGKPFYNESGVKWKNNAGALYVRFRQDMQHERILEEMTKIDLTEDVG